MCVYVRERESVCIYMCVCVYCEGHTLTHIFRVVTPAVARREWSSFAVPVVVGVVSG